MVCEHVLAKWNKSKFLSGIVIETVIFNTYEKEINKAKEINIYKQKKKLKNYYKLD